VARTLKTPAAGHKWRSLRGAGAGQLAQGWAPASPWPGLTLDSSMLQWGGTRLPCSHEVVVGVLAERFWLVELLELHAVPHQTTDAAEALGELVALL